MVGSAVTMHHRYTTDPPAITVTRGTATITLPAIITTIDAASAFGEGLLVKYVRHEQRFLHATFKS